MTTIAQIQRTVARHYGLTPDDITGRDQRMRVARPRQVAMYLARTCTSRKHSFNRIGHYFGDRHHATILGAVRRIESLRQTDPEIRASIEAIVRELGA